VTSAATPLLVRIDDRLIHGQVSVGWAGRLKPETIVVLDDEAAGDSWENDLVCSACPDRVRAKVYSVEEGARLLASGGHAGERIIILLRSVGSARRLVEAGFPVPELNIGGLHHHAGSRAYLPYVYLDPSEVEGLKALSASGVRLTAQDLPGNKSFDLSSLLDRSGG
jgi:mannose/fructose/N-acetylgalactosamine-specific phosphotransferase system component IIB